MAAISQIIIYIMLFFMLLGVIDKVFLNNRLGYGRKFEEGMEAMGVLALAMVGIMCFAPVLGQWLKGPVGAVWGAIGADPAMFAGTLLANDMGGFPLAGAMTTDQGIHVLSGLFMGCMMGATIVFSIPVSLGIIEKEDRPFLARGMLAGFVSIPFGVFTAGVLYMISYNATTAGAADPLTVGKILINLVPSVVIAVLLAVGLALIPNGMMKGFNVFAIFITGMITIMLALAIINKLGLLLGTAGEEGKTLVSWIPFMGDDAAGVLGVAGKTDPIGPQLETAGIIAITLAGAFPFVHFITTVLSKPVAALGRLMGVNTDAAAGMIAALANNIPMFGTLKQMDKRGKVLAVAFSVCASFALGDHLGYAAGVAPDAIFAMVIGKVVGGIVGIIIAMLLAVRGLEVIKSKKGDAAGAAVAAEAA
ncbi:MAG: ethanolamine utilization protein EutH [Propionibacteriaceae bacterium]|jgi:ethanolamine transporter|nr:ethanolamine utilization protein EutH [Propionibacteriaceae bacterium]